MVAYGTVDRAADRAADGADAGAALPPLQKGGRGDSLFIDGGRA
jgi:hypothetical protein